jgi:YcxB-like protein
MEFAEGNLTLSAEDCQRAMADMPEQVRSNRLVHGYAIFVMLAGLGGEWLGADLTLRGMWILFGAALLVYAQLRSRSAGQRLLRSMKEGEREVSYRFDSEGVNLKTPVSELSMSYAALRRQREGSTAFLLYTGERLAQLVPKRAFDAAQLEQIRRWLSAGVKERPQPRRFLRAIVLWLVLIVSFLLLWQLVLAPSQ